MSESASEAPDAKGVRAEGGAKKTNDAKLGFFGRIAHFVRQVVAELKKVVTPSRAELLQYTTVVIVFVAVVMAFVAGVDFVVGRGVLELFGS